MRYFLVILSALTLLGAVAAVGREYDIALLHREDPFARYMALSDEGAGTTIRLPLSRLGTTELLLTCASTQTGLIYRLQAREFQATVDHTCRTLAERIVATAPLVGGAHAVIALSTDDADARAQALLRSAAMAGYSPWQVQVRIRLGMSLVAEGNDTVRDMVLRDISIAAQSPVGRRALAQFYTQTPAYRPIIVSGVERETVGTQRAFIQEVRNRGAISN